jgi:asparagine synthetase B (glutamine-hydrolysing)
MVGSAALDGSPACRIDSLADLPVLEAVLDDGGLPALRRLRGDFALAYVDPSLSRLVLFRSLTGTRSIYYVHRTGHALLWASDVRRLFATEPGLGDVDVLALPALVTALDLDPARSCYRAVRRLPSGHALVVEDGRLRHVPPDDFAVESNGDLSLAECAPRLAELIGRAADRNLPPRGSLGALMSGGLDSSIAAYEARRDGRAVTGFHWTWPGLATLAQERAACKAVAAELGIPLALLDFMESLGPGGDYLASMQASPVPFNHSFYRCLAGTAEAAAAHGISAVATGHLGDALFHTGAPPDPAHSGTGQEAPVWWLGRPWRRPSRPDPPRWDERRVARCAPWLTDEATRAASEAGDFPYPDEHVPPDSRQAYVAVKRNLDAGGELRTGALGGAFLPARVTLHHPFADRDLIEFALGLSDRHRSVWYAGLPLPKVALRAAYLERLPPMVLRRESRSPYLAVAQTFTRRNTRVLWDLLGPRSMLAGLGIVDPPGLRRVLGDEKLRAFCSVALVRAAGVEYWLRRLTGTAPNPSLAHDGEEWSACRS